MTARALATARSPAATVIGESQDVRSPIRKSRCGMTCLGMSISPPRCANAVIIGGSERLAETDNIGSTENGPLYLGGDVVAFLYIA